MYDNSQNNKIAIALFERIQTNHPNLKMIVDLDHKNVDVSMDIPKQEGLSFSINLNLQDDELFLSMEKINCSWYPIKDKKVEEYLEELINGLIDGTYRLVEFISKGKVYKVQIQKHLNNVWETHCTNSKVFLHFPWKKYEEIETRNKT